MNERTRNTRSLTSIVTVLAAMVGPTEAADIDVAASREPESSLSAGLGYVSKDNGRFGQYTGMIEEGVYGLFDLELVSREEGTGTWVRLDGRDLALPNRELRFEHVRQGDWGYVVDFSQIPRFEPYTINTPVTGIGGDQLVVPAAATAGGDVQLKSDRTVLGIGASKWLSRQIDVQVRVRSERKDGERIFARGTPGAAGNFQFTPEPLDSTTQRLEAIVGYTADKLQLSGGYYLSVYNNGNTALNVTETGGATALAGFTPIGLPPDNKAHQVHVAGGYNHSARTRSTFKLAYGRATQDDTFIVPSLPGTTSLDGRVDTTLAQYGLSLRPTRDLSLLANLRYEDREDKTPVLLYSNLAGATSTFNGFYEPRSITTTAGKLEAGFRLPKNFRVTGGVDYDRKERFVPHWMGGALASVAVREETEEVTYRVQLRRSLSETVNGSIAYAYGDRDGSSYVPLVLNDGTAGSNLTAPLNLADRKRHKLRLSADWLAAEGLSVHFMAEDVQDDYRGRTYGPDEHRAQNYSIDAAYSISDAWQLSAWVARNETDADQTLQTGGGQPWAAALGTIGEAFGIGVRGTVSKRLAVGADLRYTSDLGEFDVTSSSAITGVTLPPDATYRVARLAMFGKYALKPNAGVRVDYAYERWRIDDWTWENWVYLDGTRVFEDPTQAVHFIGVSYYYKWR